MCSKTDCAPHSGYRSVGSSINNGNPPARVALRSATIRDSLDCSCWRTGPVVCKTVDLTPRQTVCVSKAARVPMMMHIAYGNLASNYGVGAPRLPGCIGPADCGRTRPPTGQHGRTIKGGRFGALLRASLCRMNLKRWKPMRSKGAQREEPPNSRPEEVRGLGRPSCYRAPRG